MVARLSSRRLRGSVRERCTSQSRTPSRHPPRCPPPQRRAVPSPTPPTVTVMMTVAPARPGRAMRLVGRCPTASKASNRFLRTRCPRWRPSRPRRPAGTGAAVLGPRGLRGAMEGRARAGARPVAGARAALRRDHARTAWEHGRRAGASRAWDTAAPAVRRHGWSDLWGSPAEVYTRGLGENHATKTMTGSMTTDHPKRCVEQLSRHCVHRGPST